MTQRRTVYVSRHVPKPRKGGAQPKLWAYGYVDLARLVGKSATAVRQDARRGRFNPADLASVVAYVGAAGPASHPKRSIKSASH